METTLQLPDWSGKTVLVAEDYDDNYAILAALLQKTHIRILRAHNGREAIDMTLNQPEIDIVLMDISMPEFSGIEALHHIRQQMPHKIVIAQTAHEVSNDIAAEDFDAILLKPIQRRLLIDTLKKYLS